jgi:hypothetical protein
MGGTGCSDKNSVPSGILARQEMQNVLWDMIQADQYLDFVAKDSAHINVKLEDLRLYDQVFQLHHISREKFSDSYKYYMAHPELTQTLMDSLLAMGNRLRTENYTRSVTRPTVTPPPATPPGAVHPGQSKLDSLRKKRSGLPVTPMRRPLHNPTAIPGRKLAEP